MEVASAGSESPVPQESGARWEEGFVAPVVLVEASTLAVETSSRALLVKVAGRAASASAGPDEKRRPENPPER